VTTLACKKGQANNADNDGIIISVLRLINILGVKNRRKCYSLVTENMEIVGKKFLAFSLEGKFALI
jgi:hypothetical protein